MTEQKTTLKCPLFEYLHRNLNEEQLDLAATDFKSLISLKGFDTTMKNFILKLYHHKIKSPAQRRHFEDNTTGLCISCNESATTIHALFECETNINLLQKLEQLYLNSSIINVRNLLTNNFSHDKFILKFYYIMFTVYAHCVNSAMNSNRILAWPKLIFNFNLTIKKIISCNSRFKVNLQKRIEDNLIAESIMVSLNRIV